MKPLLEIKNLSVSYFTYAGEVQSVRNISFCVQEGKTIALVGESGCGKSVTAKSVMGLIQKPGQVGEDTSILYKGKDIIGYTEKQWNDFRGKECSMIFQDALVSLNPTMNIGNQIIENLENHTRNSDKRECLKRAQEMMKMVGIPDAERCLKKYPHELSGGMRQRAMIAAAMITAPGLLVADEPTTALDVTIQAQIIKLMKDLQKKMNMSIIMITHDLGVVAEMADEIIVMYAGKIVEKGSCDEIFYHPYHPYTWALLQSVPRIDIEEKRTLVAIEGNIPDMVAPPVGCSFYDRCSYAMNICRECQPKQTRLESGHEVSCWLLDERADKSGIWYGRNPA